MKKEEQTVEKERNPSIGLVKTLKLLMMSASFALPARQLCSFVATPFRQTHKMHDCNELF